MPAGGQRSTRGGPPGSAPGLALWLLPPLAVGSLLRLWGLSRQIFLGDEVHGVASAVNRNLSEILTSYRFADPCIPLSALYRVLMETGVRLSEPVIRAPTALAGLAVLVLFPLAVGRWPELGGDRRQAVVFAWLLALSPSLIYYSRFARPYEVVVLLGTLAVAGFWRWWRGGGHRWAVLYAVAGAASAWFFLGSAPFVAAPLAWAAGDLAVHRIGGRLGRPSEDEGRGLLALTAAGAGLAAGVAAFLVPTLESFLRILRTKAVESSTDLERFSAVARMQAGTSWPLLAAAFWILAAVGLAVLLRRRRALALFTLVLVAAQWSAIALVLRPSGVGLPVVLNRYVLVTLPVVLLWVAVGVGRLSELPRGRGSLGARAGTRVAIACVGALGLGSPYLEDPTFRLGPFAGAWQTLVFHNPAPALPAEAVPAAFRQVVAESGEAPVIVPVPNLGAFNLRPLMAFGRLHDRPVRLAPDYPWLSDPRLSFRTVVPGDPPALRASGGRFVVLFLDLPRLVRLDRALARGDEDPGSSRRDRKAVARARTIARRLVEAWGEPHLSSDDVLVWDLARVR